ncbi:hypothetical protein P691DRAFT_764060 [Macrolepiota fuliginosa MF-IS2]|uniref:Uncharacterized protein n=1 Tax=Macrolepiota fuliginosa MF-IS2 TaxID=1400762 RepID=A0A9P6BY07_9AGAR|nr:hypothetical protein P691DRAFT_764060 [Macrolepiota fuliginosa MF-IS2]
MTFLISYKSILARSSGSKEQGGEQPSTSNPVQRPPTPMPPARVRDATSTVDDGQAMANPSNSVPPAVLIGPTAYGAFTNAHHFTIVSAGEGEACCNT